MAIIQNVSKIADNLSLNHVVVSCTDKRGLISNEGMPSGFPQDGLLGFLTRQNPKIKFISTGNTYSLISSQSNLNVIEMSEYTGYPEMKTGLVKSLHPKIHAGILGHIFTPDDSEFLNCHQIPTIDGVIINFYDLKRKIQEKSDFESLRQAIDVGGPTMCHAARKAFISTLLLVNPSQYSGFISHFLENNSTISLEYRLQLAKEASTAYTELMIDVNTIFQNTTISDLQKVYTIV